MMYSLYEDKGVDEWGDDNAWLRDGGWVEVKLWGNDFDLLEIEEMQEWIIVKKKILRT